MTLLWECKECDERQESKIALKQDITITAYDDFTEGDTDEFTLQCKECGSITPFIAHIEVRQKHSNKLFYSESEALKYLDDLAKNPLFENGKIDFAAYYCGDRIAFCGNKSDSIKAIKKQIASHKGELYKISI